MFDNASASAPVTEDTDAPGASAPYTIKPLAPEVVQDWRDQWKTTLQKGSGHADWESILNALERYNDPHIQVFALAIYRGEKLCALVSGHFYSQVSPSHAAGQRSLNIDLVEHSPIAATNCTKMDCVLCALETFARSHNCREMVVERPEDRGTFKQHRFNETFCGLVLRMTL